MAANLLPIQPLALSAPTPRTTRRSTAISAMNNSASSWWSPLFGWSSDPDYIDDSNTNNNNLIKKNNEGEAAMKAAEKSSKSKFRPGSFTEEKARRLRMMTMETETFHEVMYHSAIAARLATDFPRRSD